MSLRNPLYFKWKNISLHSSAHLWARYWRCLSFDLWPFNPDCWDSDDSPPPLPVRTPESFLLATGACSRQSLTGCSRFSGLPSGCAPWCPLWRNWICLVLGGVWCGVVWSCVRLQLKINSLSLMVIFFLTSLQVVRWTKFLLTLSVCKRFSSSLQHQGSLFANCSGLSSCQCDHWVF